MVEKQLGNPAKLNELLRKGRRAKVPHEPRVLDDLRRFTAAHVKDIGYLRGGEFPDQLDFSIDECGKMTELAVNLRAARVSSRKFTTIAASVFLGAGDDKADARQRAKILREQFFPDERPQPRRRRTSLRQ